MPQAAPCVWPRASAQDRTQPPGRRERQRIGLRHDGPDPLHVVAGRARDQPRGMPVFSGLLR
jgi:hypothetical protein